MTQAKPPFPANPARVLNAFGIAPAELPRKDDPAEQDGDGWRAFDASGPWQSDRPYPAESGAQPESEIDAEGDRPDDLLTAVVEALEALDGLDTAALSVEVAGDCVILRGSAPNAHEARRAEAAVLRIPGVGRVDNLLDAG